MPGPHARYGWRPQLRDTRDFRLEHDTAAKRPNSVDLRTSPHMSPIYDQGELGSCTAHGLARAFDFAYHRQHGRFFLPSRLDIYYQERVMEGTVGSDSGAVIRDGMKVLAKQGAPPEADWPYDITRFRIPPPTKVAREAVHDLAIEYRSPVQSEAGLEAAIAAQLPVVFGMSVYRSFESAKVAKTGIVPMPTKHDSLAGGHCTDLAAFDHRAGKLWGANSWSEGWGQDGYYEIDYEYVLGDLASDFWVISAVS